MKSYKNHTKSYETIENPDRWEDLVIAAWRSLIRALHISGGLIMTPYCPQLSANLGLAGRILGTNLGPKLSDRQIKVAGHFQIKFFFIFICFFDQQLWKKPYKNKNLDPICEILYVVNFSQKKLKMFLAIFGRFLTIADFKLQMKMYTIWQIGSKSLIFDLVF